MPICDHSRQQNASSRSRRSCASPLVTTVDPEMGKDLGKHFVIAGRPVVATAPLSGREKLVWTRLQGTEVVEMASGALVDHGIELEVDLVQS